MANKHILIEIAFVIVVVAAAAHKRRLQNDKWMNEWMNDVFINVW